MPKLNTERISRNGPEQGISEMGKPGEMGDRPLAGPYRSQTGVPTAASRVGHRARR